MLVIRAPVRISFGGGGTDLAAYYGRYGGFVVSVAINRYCYVTVRPSTDGSTQIISADFATWESYRPGQQLEVREPLALPKAVLERFADQDAVRRGVDLFLASEVPPGTGLGSSSAMTVALVRAIATYCEIPLESTELAELASQIEIERLEMPIGKQDQYASAFGGLNAIEFDRDGVRVRPLALAPGLAAALSERLLLFSTGTSRHSSEILRQQRSDTTRKPAVAESLHRIKALAYEMWQALDAGELDEFGQMLDASWHEKKRLSDKISSANIDAWYEAARSVGALGGKITGAGGGGFLLLYCPPERQTRLRSTLGRIGLHELTFDFDFIGPACLSPSSQRDVPAGRRCLRILGGGMELPRPRE